MNENERKPHQITHLHGVELRSPWQSNMASRILFSTEKAKKCVQTAHTEHKNGPSDTQTEEIQVLFQARSVTFINSPNIALYNATHQKII